MAYTILEERKKWEPIINAGNTVKVWQKVKEGDKFRLQSFEGLIIAHKHGMEPGATFTVRRIAEGVGVERIFPVYSPNIEKIDLVKSSRVRRSKLYYVREKAAKEIKKKMRRLNTLPPKEVAVAEVLAETSEASKE